MTMKQHLAALWVFVGVGVCVCSVINVLGFQQCGWTFEQPPQWRGWSTKHHRRAKITCGYVAASKDNTIHMQVHGRKILTTSRTFPTDHRLVCSGLPKMRLFSFSSVSSLCLSRFCVVKQLSTLLVVCVWGIWSGGGGEELWFIHAPHIAFVRLEMTCNDEWSVSYSINYSVCMFIWYSALLIVSPLWW